MNARETSRRLRRTAADIERQWVGQGCPRFAGFPLELGICAGVHGSATLKAAVDVALQRHEVPDGHYLAPFGCFWSARILWLYVMAHAIEDGAI